MGYKEPRGLQRMKVVSSNEFEPKKIVLTKLSRRTKILAYGVPHHHPIIIMKRNGY